MPIAGRMAIVLAIVLFPPARMDGLGKAFSEYTADGHCHSRSSLLLRLLRR